MPGYCLPNLTAATALCVTAGYLVRSLQQEPTPCFTFLGGISPLPIRSTGAIILTKKKHLDPSINSSAQVFLTNQPINQYHH
jgi:hypothetical protein